VAAGDVIPKKWANVAESSKEGYGSKKSRFADAHDNYFPFLNNAFQFISFTAISLHNSIIICVF
jgi:hypothetical protein